MLSPNPGSAQPSTAPPRGVSEDLDDSYHVPGGLRQGLRVLAERQMRTTLSREGDERRSGAFIPHRPRSRALERADDVEQVGVVALLTRTHAERLEPLAWVVQRVSPVLQRLSENGGFATT